MSKTCHLREKNKPVSTAGKYAAYRLGAAVGVSEIMAASTSMEMTLAIIDMGMLATDFAMNEALANRLNQTQAGKTWLDNFNKFSLAYGGTRAVVELAALNKLGKEMRQSASVINDAEVIDITTSVTGKVVSASGVLDDAFLEGWTVERVLATKPRPETFTYLKPSYISEILNIANREGVGFIVVKSWIEGSGFATFPLRKFSMIRSDMDKAISQYRITKNLNVIEEALGYDKGALVGYEDELFVFYGNQDKFTFDIPNGNEIGANSFWIPGSQTPTGAVEVVLIDKFNPSQPIIHNKSIEYLQQNFSHEKVKDF